MSYNLRPHATHVIEYGDSICSREMTERIIDYLEDYSLFTMDNQDCTVCEYEINECDLVDAIEETVDNNLKNALRKLYNESDRRDGYIHFSVF